ncbi:hypothetical protein [Pontivivens ytuae]|uniref:Flagellar basal body rod protein FlgB n=1 Tax=Pontivivens ytuae TaxID=2789856 RepID=A0A7S9LPU6_9RHOB|nr:hypothetical protein [Pontivivens ytuae]QPH53084.1 hypothetical protein I0K15_14930 [Pontivivens ytuae]
MNTETSLMKLAGEAARHAVARQSVIAQNVAQADTPGYRARDLTPFADAMARAGSPFEAKATRTGHQGARALAAGTEVVEAALPGTESLDGNTVAIEDQMMRADAARRQHDLALTLYRKSIDILRLGLGRQR